VLVACVIAIMAQPNATWVQSQVCRICVLQQELVAGQPTWSCCLWCACLVDELLCALSPKGLLLRLRGAPLTSTPTGGLASKGHLGGQHLQAAGSIV
jgi:hypothetical protein